MSVKVFITIDTEEDTWSDYKATGNGCDNISHIPIIQEIFDRYGAIPTYLVSYPVTEDEHSINILRDILEGSLCEIGTHCHPWNTPPVEDYNDRHSMMYKLPYEIVRGKMEVLHDAIIKSFKIVPVCFRAGRWGFGSEVSRVICDLGYKVDSSITPLFEWTQDDGPDFTEAPNSIYRFDPEDVLEEKRGGCLLEVPATTGFLQKHFKICNSIRKRIHRGILSRYHILGVLDRLKILNLRILSPESCSGEEMIKLSRNLILSGQHFLNMSFHSNSLLPGLNPFIRNQRELRRLLINIEMFLRFAKEEGMSFSPLSGAIGLAE